MKTQATRRFAVVLTGTVMTFTASMSLAGSPAGNGEDITLCLRSEYAISGGQSQESTTVTTREAEAGWTLSGPYFLRSADPEEPGELELKFEYGFETSDDEDEHEFKFVLEWGMMEDLEFILEMEFELGEGKVEGNGDISELGLHIRHWKEDGWMPAFATRHLMRIPTGYRSDGVDYLGRGLFTKTLVADTLRLHFNPWLKSINGNLDENERRFVWGAAIGVDYRINDDLLVIADYQNNASEEFGQRNQHSFEFGWEWEFAEDRMLGFQTEFELDGDDDGADFGVRLSYIFELEAPAY